ncbi:MAG: hypothetical protein J1F42_01815 [Lachnospiraceae bacterium]|nr:hypothetical protein [Lachnospiraceae bacterium]
MLNERQARNKLYEYAERFTQLCRKQDWAAAKFTYFRARTVAVFMELPDADMIELFGNRTYKDDREELKDGLFPEAMVEKASYECIRQNMTYDELHLRPAAPGGVDEFIDSDGEVRNVRTY